MINKKHIPAIAFFLVVLAIGFVFPHFLTLRNLVNVLRQASALGFMAIGVTIVLIAGGIDLSIPSVMALSGILGAMYMRVGGNPFLAVLIMIAVGMACGSINGLAVAYLKMIPFVVTLSTMAIAMGTCVWVTNKVSVAGIHEGFIDFVMAKVWIVPVPVIFLAMAIAIVTAFTRKSIFGRWLYAVGVNQKTARVSGIPTDHVIFGSYVFSGLFAGLAAIIVTGRLASASPTMGQEGVVLNVIGAAVVGGVSIYGGVGSPLGAVFGAIIITLISNSMNMMHVPYFTTLIIKGIVIIIIVALDSRYRQR